MILNNFLLTKHYNNGKNQKNTKNKSMYSVTGLETNVDNFYTNQNHVKAVDNLRRNSGATKEQLQRMFNQLNQYV